MITFCSSVSFAQDFVICGTDGSQAELFNPTETHGIYLPAQGELKVLVVFVRFKDDVAAHFDMAIIAIGQSPNPILQATTPDLAMSKKGTVVVDENGKTSREGIFAGGDLARGGATVILAMQDGQRAAAAIHTYLTEKATKRVRTN